MSNECHTCSEADKTGAFPEGMAHCKSCHRSWWGSEELHTVCCHRQFGSDRALLDAHRGHHCHDPALVGDSKGRSKLKSVRRNGGEVWVRRDERPLPQNPRRSVGSRRGGTNRVPATIGQGAV